MQDRGIYRLKQELNERLETIDALNFAANIRLEASKRDAKLVYLLLQHLTQEERKGREKFCRTCGEEESVNEVFID